MKYYIIAGEASGDLYGALLIKHLRELDAEAEFRFWGGDAMQAEGGEPVKHIRELAIMGFVEVVAHLGTVLGNLRFCRQDIAAYQPDVVIGIDYPGFNLKIEAWAKQQGFHTAHYISPNLWAWKKGRIKGMRQSLDLLCHILPFEQQFFAENHLPQALYVGHPLIDVVEKEYPRPRALDGRPLIVLLPGSRKQELKHSLPLMASLANRHTEYQFIVAGMSLLGKEIYESLIPEESNLMVAFDMTYRLLSAAYAAVVCSGTATLETALFDVPQVVCYRANPISIAIAKTVVSRRIRYISLVNLIADKPIVAELIQSEFNQERLEAEFSAITTDQANRRRMQADYAAMRTLLGNEGASRRTAEAIINLLR
ncbi:MAG: lipid-A-disaccharide synthase [Bacteroidales bacterium]|nr:lipid-A-disaccharide synthase [Bacteroidales bacterium]